MEYWVQTDNATGMQNLVEAFDLISWWATYMFFHLDAHPIRNTQ